MHNVNANQMARNSNDIMLVYECRGGTQETEESAVRLSQSLYKYINKRINEGVCTK